MAKSWSLREFVKSFGNPTFCERQKDGRTFHSLNFGSDADGNEIWVSRAKDAPDLSESWVLTNFAKLNVLKGTTQTGNVCYTIVESQFENNDKVLDLAAMCK